MKNPNPRATQLDRIDEVLRVKANITSRGGVPTSRQVLSAMGHPGYGEAFAARTIDAWVNTPMSTLHSLCLGGFTRHTRSAS
jgi:hypothetical protein